MNNKTETARWAKQSGSSLMSSTATGHSSAFALLHLGLDLWRILRATEPESRSDGVARGQLLRDAVGPIRQDRPQFGMDLEEECR
jgi:hypothetical protein